MLWTVTIIFALQISHLKQKISLSLLLKKPAVKKEPT